MTIIRAVNPRAASRWRAARAIALLALASLPTQAFASVPPPASCLTASHHNRAAAASGPTPDGVAAARLSTLARGVNVTDLFGPEGEPDPGATFRQLRQSGIRHVRIPVSPDIFAANPPAWQREALARLDQAVCAAVSERLGVIIDLHPFGPLGPPGQTDAMLTARLADVWRQLAGRYARASADDVFFEVFNEPKLPDPQAWASMQNALVRAIRAVAPRNTIIATASPWSMAIALSGLTPVADRDVVYAFHFYTPMIFTHQGAGWALPDYASVRGLTFPAVAANVAAVARGAAPEREAELADYGRRFGDTRAIAGEIDQAAFWGHQHGVPIVVTEFGVYGAAPPAARASWLAAVSRLLEARKIGWTLWEYQGGFGIAQDLRRGCAWPDSAAAALGLCAP